MNLTKDIKYLYGEYHKILFKNPKEKKQKEGYYVHE